METIQEISSLEISAQGVDKGVGLKKLCEYLDIPIDQTIAVGDADNDLEVFERAGVSICARNGTGKAKEKAMIVSSYTNEEDLVGREIQTLMTNDFQL